MSQSISRLLLLSTLLHWRHLLLLALHIRLALTGPAGLHSTSLFQVELQSPLKFLNRIKD